MTAAITIGMPVYNGAQYLDQALESLCAQEFADLEILVSDNASTDATAEILEKWAARDKRVRVYRQDKNIGAVANFDWLLNAAQSRWFMFAAYDDRWSPGYVDALYKAVTRKQGTQLAAPQMVTFFDDGREDIRKAAPVRQNAIADRVARIRFLLKSAHSGWYYGLFDRKSFVAATAWSKAFRHVWGADYIVLLPFILGDTVAGDDGAIYYKRLTPLSEERYRPKTAEEGVRLYRDFLKNALSALKASPLGIPEKIAVAPALYSYVRHGEKFRRVVRKTLKKFFHKN